MPTCSHWRAVPGRICCCCCLAGWWTHQWSPSGCLHGKPHQLGCSARSKRWKTRKLALDIQPGKLLFSQGEAFLDWQFHKNSWLLVVFHFGTKNLSKKTLDCSKIQLVRRLTASEVSALWPNSISRPRSALGNTGLSSYKCELLKSSVDHQERRRKQMSKRRYYSPGESRLGAEFQDQVRTVRELTPDWSSNQERDLHQ